MDFSTYTTKNAAELFKEFNTSDQHGLTSNQVKQNLQKYGPNQIVADTKIFWWRIFLRQFKSSFIYLLLAAAVISFFLGEAVDAFMIFIFVLINSGLGFYQEYHSEKTIKLLKKYVVVKTKVIRNGSQQYVQNSDLVPGDLIILEAGDEIGADVRFIEESNLEVDEAVISGESVTVRKIAAAIGTTAGEIYQAENIGFAGTIVVAGWGKAIVFATAKNTVFGQIAKLTVETDSQSSFEKGISKFSQFILRLILVTLVIVFVANLAIKGDDANVIELIIFSLALTVSVIPEGLPAVTTFSLSRGAQKLAKNQVVVKRLSAVEDLGSVQVLCSDKTGTLTENKLKVADIFSKDQNQTLFYAALASSSYNTRQKEPNNAFDLAVFNKLSGQAKKQQGQFLRSNEIPFDPTRRRNSVLVKSQDESFLIVRGASESIIGNCANLNYQLKNEIERWEADCGRLGRRIIAVATRPGFDNVNYQVADEEKNLEFVGAIAFEDPIKKSAFEAVNSAKELGVQIKILTGDRKEVAGAVGYQVGLVENPNQVITGAEFEKLNSTNQLEACFKYAVFARVTPEQKFEIIKILQQKYEVGFLGEGINDAPALKIANVALVVETGADIAKEAADIVLLQPSLEVIVDGVRSGREIFVNITKYIKATLSSNFGNFYAIATASLLIKFLPMLPVQILLVNLLSDFPMIAIAADNVDSGELKRPRLHNVSEIATIATLLGIVSGIFDFIFFWMFYKMGPQVLQTNWFIASILTELVFLFSIRTKLFAFKAKKPAPVLIFLSIVAFGATLILPYLTFGESIFQFIRPNTSHLILILAIVGIYFIVSESTKLIYYQRFGKN